MRDISISVKARTMMSCRIQVGYESYTVDVDTIPTHLVFAVKGEPYVLGHQKC